MNKLSTVAKAILATALYAVVFYALWHLSFDQWYLPAGLRFACFFIAPRNWRPWFALGDFIGLSTLRTNLALSDPSDEYTLQWAYISSLFVSSSAWLFATLIDKITPGIDRRKYFAVTSLAYATSLKAVTILANKALSGPALANSFLLAVVGDYLGILVIALPILAYVNRSRWNAPPKTVVVRVAWSIALIALLYVTTKYAGERGPAVRLMPMLFMLVPAIYLSLIFGWNGAAIGCSLVNVGIALALPQTWTLGVADELVLSAQVGLFVASFVLLAIGWHITHLADEFAQSITALKAQNRSFVNMALGSTERKLRDHAMLLLAAAESIDELRNTVVDRLRAKGLAEDAWATMVAGSETRKILVANSAEAYPFDIENSGLFAVLMSDVFSERWDQKVKITKKLIGASPKVLSIATRLAAYRSICMAIDTYIRTIKKNVNDSLLLTMKARVVTRHKTKGVLIEVKGQQAPPIHELSVLAHLVEAYGGTFKYRHRRGVAFFFDSALTVGGRSD